MVVKPKPGKVYPKNVTAASLANLKPFNKMTREENKRLSTKGGSANKNNPKHRLGKRMQYLKERGLTDENAKKLYDLVTNSNMSALDTRLFIESIKKNTKGAKDQLTLANTLISWHKSTFGEKIKTENVNININKEMTDEETDKLMDFMEGK